MKKGYARERRSAIVNIINSAALLIRADTERLWGKVCAIRIYEAYFRRIAAEKEEQEITDRSRT